MTADALPVPKAPEEIRAFPLTASDGMIRRALAKLEGNPGVAFIAGYDGETKEARLAVASKIGDDWSFSGYLEKRPQKSWAGEFAITWTP